MRVVKSRSCTLEPSLLNFICLLQSIKALKCLRGTVMRALLKQTNSVCLHKPILKKLVTAQAFKNRHPEAPSCFSTLGDWQGHQNKALEIHSVTIGTFHQLSQLRAYVVLKSCTSGWACPAFLASCIMSCPAEGIL